MQRVKRLGVLKAYFSIQWGWTKMGFGNTVASVNRNNFETTESISELIYSANFQDK